MIDWNICDIRGFFMCKKLSIGLVDIRITIPDSLGRIVDHVKSFSQSGCCYEVNTGEMTCSCPDFVERRAGFERDDIRRLCKHMIMVFQRNGALRLSDSLFKSLLEFRPAKDNIYQGVLNSGEPVLLFVSKGDDFIEVYTRKRRSGDIGGKYTGDYDRFSYSIQMNRWNSYDMKGPPGASEIKTMLKQIPMEW